MYEVTAVTQTRNSKTSGYFDNALGLQLLQDDISRHTAMQ